jgi:hypothetical protein
MLVQFTTFLQLKARDPNSAQLPAKGKEVIATSIEVFRGSQF